MDKKEKDKQWRLNNKAKILLYNTSMPRREKERERDKINRPKKLKIAVDNLKDSYVVNVIKNRTGISKKIIRKYPDYIEAYRQQIKLKRLINQKKNGNTKTK